MSELIELDHERFIIRLLYNTTEHLLKRPLYTDFNIDRCYAHPDLHKCMMQLPPKLKALGLKLVIYDCYRPLDVQREMWKILPDERYVAPPERGSKHNRGVAIDCYLAKEDGTPLEFPTVPDAYLPGIEKDMAAWMKYLEKAHHSYQCPPEDAHKAKNRNLLRSLMESVGLKHLEEEWWHYELPNASNYPLIEAFVPKRMASND